MRTSFLQPGVRRVLMFQVASVALVSSVALASSGQAGAAVLMVHVAAQAAKTVLVLLSLLAAFASGKFAAGSLIIGTGVALLAHWLSFLFHR